VLVRRLPAVSQKTNYNAIVKEKYINNYWKQNEWPLSTSLLCFSDLFLNKVMFAHV
jgi:hypothetical protein